MLSDTKFFFGGLVSLVSFFFLRRCRRVSRGMCMCSRKSRFYLQGQTKAMSHATRACRVTPVHALVFPIALLHSRGCFFLVFFLLFSFVRLCWLLGRALVNKITGELTWTCML